MITKMYDFKLIQPWDLTLKMHYKLNKALINQPTNTPLLYRVNQAPPSNSTVLVLLMYHATIQLL